MPQLESLDWWKPPIVADTPPSRSEALRAQRIETEKKIEQHLADSPRKLIKFRRLLSDAQHLEPVREEQVSQLGLPWPVMRRGLQRLGETFVESGSINSVDDVFFLTRSELVSLLHNPIPMDHLINTRREDRRTAARLAAPADNCSTSVIFSKLRATSGSVPDRS